MLSKNCEKSSKFLKSQNCHQKIEKEKRKRKTVVVVGPQNILSFSLKPKRIKPLPSSTFYISMEMKPCQS